MSIFKDWLFWFNVIDGILAVFLLYLAHVDCKMGQIKIVSHK